MPPNNRIEPTVASVPLAIPSSRCSRAAAHAARYAAASENHEASLAVFRPF